MKPRVALISFSEPRDEFLELRRHLVDEEVPAVTGALGQELELVTGEPVRSKSAALAAARRAVAEGAHAVLLHFPIWSPPNFAVIIADQVSKPVLVLGNRRTETSSMIGVLGAGAALDQVGIRHRRVLGDPREAPVRAEIVSYCRAANALGRLRGMTYGQVGGRSMGIYSTTADPSEWMRIFGVDTEHIDQAEIIRLAGECDEKEVEAGLAWLKASSGKVEYNGPFNEESLRRQLQSYLACRRIITERNLDFLGIKCQTELSDHFAIQCLGISLLNDPYDWRGEKEPVVCACEADSDGALTMQILKLLSGGQSSALLDVRLYEEHQKVLILANCGSMPTSMASWSRDAAENLSKVHLVRNVIGKAGGAATQMVAGESEVTLARLMRRSGQYWLGCLRGYFLLRPRDSLRKTTWPWPHAFLKANLDFDRFLHRFGSNHLHPIRGEYLRELKDAAELLGIECEVYT